MSRFETVSISTLKPDPKNARKHDKRNLDAIKGSLVQFGQQKPIVVTPEGVVVAGNGTLAAAKALGWETIEVVRTELEPEKLKAYALADNRTAELAAWDDEQLNATLAELSAVGFDLPSIGFDFTGAVEAAPGCDEDEVPEKVEPKTKPGDIYTLGNHRLLCGDSTNVSNLERLLSSEKAEMVFTDPPYRMDATGGSNQMVGRAAAKLGERIAHLCEFDPVAFLNALPLAFEVGRMNAYVFCNKDLVPDYLNWAVDSGLAFNILVWKKPTSIPLGGQYRPDLEYLLFFRKGATWNNAVEGASYTKCLEFNRERSDDHPTLKPVGLIANAILLSSSPGGLIVEFFLGSGSTLIACEKTGRRCFGMEIDPHYCDVIVARWERFTGKQAVLEQRENSDG